mmetsp:Transcript_50091/g.122279  ORF Transcript_50091/g.122279 Transcript_50091/m.122279 type:complete len:233 (-) Transcript_50091:117-815(-)
MQIGTTGFLKEALYVPNLIGYFRILLVWLAWSSAVPAHFVGLVIFSSMLDLVDGPIARWLGQESYMGMLLDVIADNLCRTALWLKAGEAQPSIDNIAHNIIILEWSTFFATQYIVTLGAEHWKHRRERDPWLVRKFFSNNFKNWVGIIGITGLFSAPAHVYVTQKLPSWIEGCPVQLWMVLGLFMFLGRGVCMIVEFYLLFDCFTDAMGRERLHLRSSSCKYSSQPLRRKVS